MCRVAILFLCMIGTLSADVAIIFDCAYQAYHIDLEKYSPPTKKDDPVFLQQQWYHQLHYALKQQGEKVFPTNLYDDELATFSARDVRAVIFCNIPVWRGSGWEKIVRKLHCKKILICWEPPSVIPNMYNKNVLKMFDAVLTWNPALVDNKRIFRFYYPVLTTMAPQTVPFEMKKLLTQVSCNKKSSHRHELYSQRKAVIDFFETQKTNDFQFFGRGWENLGYQNYGGTVDDKRKTLQNFRFSVCFENISHIRGYVTEKIFDCFEAGCIPIYRGASDITRYVPQNCFLSWGQFGSIRKMYRYLKQMPEAKYKRYITNILSFLSSKRAQRFTQKKLASTLLQRYRALAGFKHHRRQKRTEA